MRESLQTAVDTGGTFTDVAIRREDGSLFVWKVPSTPDAPDDAVIDGITGAIEELGADITSISQFVHGTTVATNTVITRTGARVGLVTTAGFRDMLTIGHQARPSLYDQHRQRSKPLVPDELISEVSERVCADATIIPTSRAGRNYRFGHPTSCSRARRLGGVIPKLFRQPRDECDNQLADTE